MTVWGNALGEQPRKESPALKGRSNGGNDTRRIPDVGDVNGPPLQGL